MKKLTICILIISACNTTRAQYYEDNDFDLIHSVGVSYYTSFLTQVPAIHYQPRLNFYNISFKDAISVDIRLAGGYFEEPQDIAGDYYLVFETPVLVNYHHGCGATRFTNEAFGYYGGIGWSNEWAFQNYFAFGPMANAGIRFDIAERSPIDINVGFMYDISGNYNSVLSAGISYVFGMLK